MKRFLTSLVVVLMFVSCNLDDDDANNFTLETLPIKEAIVPDEFTYGSEQEITIKYDLLNGCYSFYNLYYQYDNDTRIVAVNSLLNQNAQCTEGIIEEEYTFTVKVVQHQDYVFKFWKGTDANGESIFEVITVPVNE
tara:strand:- start:271952 stop:272362 length:411 start_codon:yes stop_codon:yes gene_type:complete